ncbi:hypothetical protein COV82_05860 [Candidatus Peregrinibacteria bacterium CG11_big_fil_rev_8_21_14_0_20_46_8]|nr:MAG: hypothetical protein COV82_05860 [Candidatus Peregrinibacteria bacterium CG11_big_fil_rev_8_21_14_0_20_46_8]
MKKIYTLLATLVIIGALTPLVGAESLFPDADTHIYNEPIHFLKEHKFVSGYPDGTFGPENQLNRAELVTILVTQANPPIPSTTCFPDVPVDAWYARFVCYAKSKGIVAGYPDGNFGPANTVNFVEAVVMMNRLFGIDFSTASNPWFRDGVEKASTSNLIPHDITSFALKITRAQMAEMMTRFVKNDDNTLAEYLGSAYDRPHSYAAIESGTNAIAVYVARDSAQEPKVKQNPTSGSASNNQTGGSSGGTTTGSGTNGTSGTTNDAGTTGSTNSGTNTGTNGGTNTGGTGTQTLSYLATNIQSADYGSTSPVYANVFKQGSHYLTQSASSNQPWDTGEADQLILDTNGWVRSIPNSLTADSYAVFMMGNGGYNIAGDYHIYWDGEGTITFPFTNQSDIRSSQITANGGHVVISMPGTHDGFLLKVSNIDPNNTGNYVRNIRVIAPGSQDGDIFTQSFLNEIRNYRAVRFMQFMRTNDVLEPVMERFRNTGVLEEIGWEERVKMNDHNWSDGPIEMTFELAAQAGIDPWITFPAHVSDEYIEESARAARARLGNGSQTIYVEYSNEVWNGGYPYSLSGEYVRESAYRDWPDTRSLDAFTVQMNWFGKRTADICRTWKRVWSEGTDQSGRINCVMASQIGGDYVHEQALDCPLAVARGARPCYEQIDSLATAPYFGGGGDLGEFNETNTARVRQWMQEPDGGFASLFAALDTRIDEMFGYIEADAAFLANKPAYSNIEMIAYEGGQHLVWDPASHERDASDNLVHEDLINFYRDASRHARMKTAYDRYLAGWVARGGKLFAHYTHIYLPTIWGNWGAREHFLQTANPADGANYSPKYHALLEFGQSGAQIAVTNPDPQPNPTPTPTPAPAPTPAPEPEPTPDPNPTPSDPPQGLVAHWNFNISGSSPALPNTVSSNYAGTASGSVTCNGTACTFGPGSAYNVSSYPLPQDAPNGATGATWIKLPETGPNAREQFVWEMGAENFALKYFSGGSGFHCIVRKSDETFFFNLDFNTFQPQANTWYHLACVFERNADGSGFVKFYANGSEVTSERVTVTGFDRFLDEPSKGMGIACRFPFPGVCSTEGTQGIEMDDLKIYNQALNASQVQSLYQAGR